MKDVTLEQTEEQILTFDVSDEALEAAGDARSQNAYTLGACTGLSVCPG
jgi:Pyruvate/2-oxoacid:ferredoxin oxidoreductase gamma subunit